MNRKDVIWSNEIKDFAAYLFGFLGVSEQAADYLWSRAVGWYNLGHTGVIEVEGLEQGIADVMMSLKEYKDIVRLLHSMKNYFGHDHPKEFVDYFKEQYFVEVKV